MRKQAGIWIESVEGAKAFPDGLVFEEMRPVLADASGSAQGLGIIDEAKDVDGEFSRKFAEEIVSEQVGDCGRDEAMKADT